MQRRVGDQRGAETLQRCQARSERGALESFGRATTVDPLESSETTDQVRDILAVMPLKYRALLVLRDIDGFTSKEIAEIAGWNHATVRWRLHRARKLFRSAWTEAGLPEDF